MIKRYIHKVNLYTTVNKQQFFQPQKERQIIEHKKKLKLEQNTRAKS